MTAFAGANPLPAHWPGLLLLPSRKAHRSRLWSLSRKPSGLFAKLRDRTWGFSPQTGWQRGPRRATRPYSGSSLCILFKTDITW